MRNDVTIIGGKFIISSFLLKFLKTVVPSLHSLFSGIFILQMIIKDNDSRIISDYYCRTCAASSVPETIIIQMMEIISFLFLIDFPSN